MKTDKLKFIQEMIKDYENKETIKQKNLKTEFNYIKKIQQQYVELGGSMHELEQIKQKAIKSFQDGRLKGNVANTNE